MTYIYRLKINLCHRDKTCKFWDCVISYLAVRITCFFIETEHNINFNQLGRALYWSSLFLKILNTLPVVQSDLQHYGHHIKLKHNNIILNLELIL